jgi:glycosyltransferase involved in cell wall biosynthesis
MAAEVSFSVVMAAHDSARTIRDAIASVLLQTRDDWELIVVDDGSSDGTAAIASSLGDERIRIVPQDNRGPAAARNAGVRLARAALVSMLDSDDLWLPGYLDTMARVLDANREAALAYTDAWVLDDSTGRVRKTTEMTYQRPPDPPPVAARAFLEELIRRNFVYNSVTARREVLLELGGYDERLWTGEDWELWLRVAASGRRCVRAPGVLAVHRDHVGSLSSDAERMRLGDREVYRIIEHDWETDDEIRKLAQALGRSREHGSRGARTLAGSLSVARSLRRAVRRRTLWHRRPPREVADLLAALARPVEG